MKRRGGIKLEKLEKYGETRSYQAPINDTKESYDQRRSSYYDHQSHNLKARDELKRRGVKDGTPNLPRADYTFDGAERRMRESKAQRKKDRYLDQVTRSLKGK